MRDGLALAIAARMARRPRLQFPGAVYHVMARGNRKSVIVDDDDDRRAFTNTFVEAAGACHVRVYSWCLMSTHYHALIDTPRGNLSAFGRMVNGEYSKTFNRRHGRVGHTFEQRFHSIVVQREKYLRRVARYIVLNPVKARLCGDAAEWRWSTHRATAGLDEVFPWLYLDWLRWAFRAEALPEAQRRYREYVRDPAGLTWSFDPGATLGTARFRKALGESQAPRGGDRLVPAACRRCPPPSLTQLFATADADLRSRDARILVAYSRHGYRLIEIAGFLGVAPSTVSKALGRARGWRWHVRVARGDEG
jgi:REP element-mobilizing transposase RayT